MGQLAVMLDVPTPSRASPLPQGSCWNENGWLSSFHRGSGLAREGGGSVGGDAGCADAFAGEPAPTRDRAGMKMDGSVHSIVGAGSRAKAVGQLAVMLDVPTPSRASPLRQGISDFIRPWQCRATVRLSTRSTIRHTARPADSQPGTAQTGYGTPSPRIRSKRPVPTQSARPVSRQSAA